MTRAAVTAGELRPRPQQADGDRGRVFRDGCLVDQRSTATKRCVYGKRRSPVTVVLFGDSEAMQFFPPLVRIARSRGWRLVTRLRAGCTPADVKFAFRCDRWRDRTLRLIVRRDRPHLIVVTGGVAYTAVRNGRRLSSRASAPSLRRGYARTLRRLRRLRRYGARLAVIKDTPRSPRTIPECVLRHPPDAGSVQLLASAAHQPRVRPTGRRRYARGAAARPDSGGVPGGHLPGRRR